MERISEIMDRRCMQLDLEARDKVDAVRELVQLLADAGKIDCVSRYVYEVMEREEMSSTGIGRGIALPHRLVAGVSNLMIAVGRKGKKGVPFDSMDGKPAHLIFLIIGPQGDNNKYLKVLSTLSLYLNDRDFFEALMRAGCADEVMRVIHERECRE